MRTAAFEAASDDTGPIGPVAFSALLFLVAASPLIRGGNRHAVLIVLEAAALVFLAAICFQGAQGWPRPTRRSVLLALLVLSPAWLALAYLLPLPAGLWAAMPGRGVYADLLAGIGARPGEWRPLSLVPDATRASLLAGLPLMAAFLAGLGGRVPQLKALLTVLVAVACFEVVLGLLQAAGGADSSLNFGAIGGRPLGTFANPNHFANFVALALAGYIWVAWLKLSQHPRIDHMHAVRFRRSVTLHAALAVLLLLGVLMSRSRGAALGGLSAAVAALAIALTVGRRGLPLKTTMLVIGGVLAVGMFLVGFDVVLSRFDLGKFSSDASMRSVIASATLDGAAAFWPLGAGWGTYSQVFPRFQPASSASEAFYHAHQDYAQMLFEGGVFAVVLMAVFAWLAVTRALYLVRAGIRNRRLRREEMAAAICGLGLLGFLLHSLVEFNMHIPANAIIASLFAGIYLRPLKPKEEEAPGD